MGWLAVARVLVVKVAVAVALKLPLPRATPLSEQVTVPVGLRTALVAGPVMLTVAMTGSASAVSAVLLHDALAVLVPAGLTTWLRAADGALTLKLLSPLV